MQDLKNDGFELIGKDIIELNDFELYKLMVKTTHHELRNVLSVIIGYSDILKCNINKHNDASEITYISEASNRAKILLDQLNYSEIINGVNKVNVGDFLFRLITLLNQINRKVDISCFFEFNREYHILNVPYLEQILLNVLTNAIYAVTESDPRGHVYIEFLSHNDHFEIQIHDTGIGILDSDLDKIFNLFFTTKGDCGTGIGLSVTLNLVKQLKGSIHVNNEDWTTFTICIPK